MDLKLCIEFVTFIFIWLTTTIYIKNLAELESFIHSSKRLKGWFQENVIQKNSFDYLRDGVEVGVEEDVGDVFSDRY